MSREEIIEAISNMTVLDLAALVKELEEKFGVSAAAPVAVAAATAATAEVEEEEEQTEFTVMLTEVGDQKVQVIKVVRELTSLGLREAKAAVDGAPAAVLENVNKDDAKAAKEKLEAVGAKAEIK